MTPSLPPIQKAVFVWVAQTFLTLQFVPAPVKAWSGEPLRVTRLSTRRSETLEPSPSRLKIPVQRSHFLA
jgi:hypothetical protein